MPTDVAQPHRVESTAIELEKVQRGDMDSEIAIE